LSRRLRTHPEAAEEFLSAAEWYELQRPSLGTQFEAEVDAVLADLESGLAVSSWVRGRNRKVRRIILKRFPYDIVFLEHGEGIVVVAVAHHARRPGYWRHRLQG
jgi:plasmid stabilization system protein ParE